jgi:hypothetical protein
MLQVQSTIGKNMKEYRRPSLPVIDERGNVDEFVIPSIEVTSCDDITSTGQNKNERFSALNGLLSYVHSDG